MLPSTTVHVSASPPPSGSLAANAPVASEITFSCTEAVIGPPLIVGPSSDGTMSRTMLRVCDRPANCPPAPSFTVMVRRTSALRSAAGVKLTPGPLCARKVLRAATVPVSVMAAVPVPVTVTPPPLVAVKTPAPAATLSVAVMAVSPASTSAMVIPATRVVVSSATSGASVTAMSSRTGPELPPSRLLKESVVVAAVAVKVKVWFNHPMLSWPRPALLN